jgi:hypothetical protein
MMKMKEFGIDSSHATAIINYFSVSCAKSHTWNRIVGENRT